MYHPLCRVDDLPEGAMQAFEVAGHKVLAGKVDGQIFVCRDRCPHADFPLSEGRLCGRELTCSFHGWAFDALSGQSLPEPSAFKLKPYPFKIEQGEIRVWIRA